LEITVGTAAQNEEGGDGRRKKGEKTSRLGKGCFQEFFHHLRKKPKALEAIYAAVWVHVGKKERRKGE